MMAHRSISTILLIVASVHIIVTPVLAGSEIGDRKKQISMIENRINTDKPLPERPVLGDYIRVGLLRNPGLKTTFYKWKADFKKIAQAFSLPDPQFTYTEYIEEVETRVGPQQRAYSLIQKFPLPDKLWIRKNKAFKASEKAYYDFEKKRLELVYDIADAYYEYAYIAKAIALTEENMKLLMNFENVAQAKYASGLVDNHDLLKVQVELGMLENDLLSRTDLRKPIIARLNALLNLSEYNELPWPDETLEYDEMTDTYDVETFELAGDLRENNPELLGLSKNIEKNREALKLSKREYFPDLSVGVTTITTDDALNGAAIDSGKDPVTLMFSVNVPIWFLRLQASVEEARASLMAAESLRDGKEQELLSHLALVHYKLRDAMRQVLLYKEALIPKAVQTMNATQSGYEAGNVDFLSLIDAQRVLLNFQLSYYRNSTNLYQRRAELKTLLGESMGFDEIEGY